MNTTTVIFVDSRVSSLLPHLTEIDCFSTRIVVLSPDNNGITQMGETLQDMREVENIHILSHGQSASIQLGNQWLDNTNVYDYVHDLAVVGRSLKPAGNILLYGCHVGAGATGEAFVGTLAQMMGTNVAASTNITGQGGDWVLELQVGSISAETLSFPEYEGQLASYNFSGNAAGYRVETQGNSIRVVDIDASNGDTGSVTLSSGSASLAFTDRTYTAQVPSGRLGEFRVNTTTEYDQTVPAITTLNNGGFVVAWQSGSYIDYNIHSQRFSSLGFAVSSEYVVNTNTLFDQSSPAVVSLGTRGYVIAWQSGTLNDCDIYFQRFDINGNKLGEETVVNTSLTGDQSNPVLTVLSSGNYVVAWQDNQPDQSKIYARLFDYNGVPLGTEVQISLTSSYGQALPAIASLANGGYVVAWQSNEQDGSGNGIYTQHFDSTGTRVGVEQRVNSTLADHQQGAAVVSLGSNGYVVVWQSNNQDGSGYGVYAQRFDSAGNPVGNETRVNTSTALDQSAPSVTSLSTGGYVITWESHDGSGSGIYAQQYDSTGNPLGSEKLINVTTTFGQLAPAVTATSNGGYVVTWVSDAQDGSSWGIYAQRFDADGFPVAVTVGGTDNADALNAGNGAQRIDGYAGNDTLDGGAGADSMDGGNGSDTYMVDNVADTAVDTGSASGDVDVVRSSVTYTLHESIENIVLLGTTHINGTGNESINQIVGNDGNNVLFGSGGSDTLMGSAGHDTLDGGAGADNMSGGTGNDVYRVDHLEDLIQELVNEGTDTVESALSWTLGNNVEYLTLTGAGNLFGTGNTLNNRITGNSAANVLDGKSGADTLIGGDSSDTYYVDNAGDVVTETHADRSTGGSDTVYTSLSTYTLTTNVENGIINTSATANLTGNALNNWLNAGSGTGNNVFNGGAGADMVSYSRAVSGVSVSLALSTAQATGSSGSDTLLNIENLQGSVHGDMLTGNAGANRLEGLAGNDTLIGGAGRDTLVGGLGADRFVFNQVTDSGITRDTWDVVPDFDSGADKIDLSGMDADTLVAGDQSFISFATGGVFSGSFATTASLYFDSTSFVLYGNNDADAQADFAIALTGIVQLLQSDLIL